MKIDWINSWRKGNKQDDKLEIVLRCGRLTFLDVRVDVSKLSVRVIVFNFGFELKK